MQGLLFLLQQLSQFASASDTYNATSAGYISLERMGLVKFIAAVEVQSIINILRPERSKQQSPTNSKRSLVSKLTNLACRKLKFKTIKYQLVFYVGINYQYGHSFAFILDSPCMQYFCKMQNRIIIACTCNHRLFHV